MTVKDAVDFLFEFESYNHTSFIAKDTTYSSCFEVDFRVSEVLSLVLSDKANEEHLPKRNFLNGNKASRVHVLLKIMQELCPESHLALLRTIKN